MLELDVTNILNAKVEALTKLVSEAQIIWLKKQAQLMNYVEVLMHIMNAM